MVMFVTSSFTLFITWKQFKCSTNNNGLYKDVVVIYIDYEPVMKKMKSSCLILQNGIRLFCNTQNKSKERNFI